MKKILLLLCISLLTSVSYVSAQQASDVDPRIRNHYTGEQVDEMLATAPLKIKVLNIYYRSSFVLIEPVNNPGHELIDPSTVDVTSFEQLRKENDRVRVGYTRTGYVLELLSKQELQALYDQATSN
jgi:hypothetical protein